MFDYTHYVPILKWRQGEYQALMRTPAAIKKCLTPLIELPPIEWDFEKGKLAKTIDEHVRPFADRVAKKWGKALVFVDCSLLDEPRIMRNGTSAISHIFSDLRNHDVHAIPVSRLTENSQTRKANAEIFKTDRRGIALRVTLEEFVAELDDKVSDHLSGLGVEKLSEVDLIVDLGSPNFQPIGDFSDLLISTMGSLYILDFFRTFTIAGSSFPSSMAELSKPISIVNRDEWILYKAIVANAPEVLRLPTFGDYAIAHPELPSLDMRLLKPSATIRYTIDDAWRISKGNNVRDYGFGQYKGICFELSVDSAFQGETLSWGDAYIKKCGAGIESTGNLTTWRGVGTNHHIAKIVSDLASFHAS